MDINQIKDKKFRELTYRLNTRYWLETHDDWPTNKLPVKDKFVTFTPWHGGFNNIRMSLEMALAAAFAFDRTLVLPPPFKLYLRGKSDLMDYFDLEDLQKGFSVITYDEFLDIHPAFKEAQSKHELPGSTMHSKVDSYFTGLKDLPKGTVVSIDEEKVGKKIGIDFMFCVPNCPEEPSKSSLRGNEKTEVDKNIEKELNWYKNFKKGSRFFVNTDDPEYVNSEIIHFGPNLLGQFYAMVYFRDPGQYQLLMKKMKDHLHFQEEIFEYAEKIIKKLGDFKYSCLHVRRNEFQFEHVRQEAKEIRDNIEGLLRNGEQIYIATDELSKDGDKNKKHVDFNPLAMTKKNDHVWFQSLFDRYGRENIHFLDEYFEKDLKDAPSIWIGSIEEVVCSRSRVFIGTRLSTFSGYINRLRGYMSDVGQKLVLDFQAKYPYDYYYYQKGPSWSLYPTNSYGGSHPSWSKEYKEVWDGVYEPV